MLEKPILVPHWLQIQMATRAELRKVFGIPRSSGTIVDGQRVVSDGVTQVDLLALTVEKMQAFTGSSHTDLIDLLSECVKKIETPEQAVEEKKEEVIAVLNLAPDSGIEVLGTQSPPVQPETVLSTKGKKGAKK